MSDTISRVVLKQLRLLSLAAIFNACINLSSQVAICRYLQWQFHRDSNNVPVLTA
ncbi:hypothetical protein D3C84_1279430 [compost metagenome]